MTRGGEARRLRGAATPASVLGFSPDGRRLVSGHEDGTLLVWDVAEGWAPLCAFLGHEVPDTSMPE